MKIIYGTWTVIRGELFLHVWDSSLRSKFVKPIFNPHFWIRREDFDKASYILRRHSHRIAKIAEPENHFAADTKSRLVFIATHVPGMVPTIRDELEEINIVTYESDIAFIRNVIISWDELEIEPNPNKIWVDIEVDSRKGIWPEFPNPPAQPILSIGFVTRNAEYWYSSESEKDTILDFLKDAKKFPLWIGWNSDKFDRPYLELRMKQLGIRQKIEPCQWLDLLLILKEFTMKEPKHLKLDYWAKKLLGIGKLVEEPNAEEIYKWYVQNREMLKRYNLRDCELTRDIDLTFSMSDYRVKLASLTKLFYEQTGRFVLRNGEFRQYGGKNLIVENTILMKARRLPKKLHFPRRIMREKIHKKGSKVLSPIPGYYERVLYLDFMALYPSIVMSFNIGFDTFAGNLSGPLTIRTPVANFFRKPRSVFALCLEELMAYRNNLKRELKKLEPGTPRYGTVYAMQYAAKVVMNSFIGVFGFESSRFFRKEIFESVTGIARWILMRTKEFVENKGLKVIYGDTDSVFVKYSKDLDVEALMSELNEYVKQRAVEEFGVPEEYYCIKIKIDDIFDKIYFLPGGQSKRYFGWPSENRQPNPLNPQEAIIGGRLTKIVGVDIVRRNTFDLLTKAQEKVIETILLTETENYKHRVVKSLKQFLDKMKHLLYSGMLDKLLIFTVGTKTNIEEYKSNLPHVKVAKKLAKMGLLLPGDVVKFVVVGRDSEGKLAVEPVINNKIPPISREGYDYYWERIMNMIETIVGVRISGSSILDDFTNLENKEYKKEGIKGKKGLLGWIE
ncbi:hypothetical protein DRP04_05040 [Archaeoglobales archaeon]|nr:MAG: hypothetical protein DRP04_05040 [Archaeoglobales archaeon]